MKKRYCPLYLSACDNSLKTIRSRSVREILSDRREETNDKDKPDINDGVGILV